MADVATGAWEREDVSDWPVRGVEQVGSTRNLWLEEPGTSEWWLHKDTVIPSNGVEQGEDWSEVVSTAVARRLGVPCATTRLCVRGGRRGSLSRSIRPHGHSLWEGIVVLQRVGPRRYFPHMEGQPGVDPSRPDLKRPGHSLANIRSVLEGVDVPSGFDAPVAVKAFDVFAGYMVLDALIANRDRHEQNWAILTSQLLSSPERLAPSYDHASSLGYNLTDTKRTAILGESGRLQSWAHKGTAYRFEHAGRPPTLVEHARHAVAMCSSTGADWWRHRLDGLDLTPVKDSLRERAIPDMSALAIMFAIELLDLNLRRLRDAIGHHA